MPSLEPRPLTAASVVVHVERRAAGQASIVFRRISDKAVVSIDVPDAERRLNRMKRLLSGTLDEFRRTVGSAAVELSSTTSRKAVQMLIDLSYGLFTSLLGDPRRAALQLGQLQRLFRPLLTAAGDGSYPLVELIGRDEEPLIWNFPLELLPLGEGPEAALMSFLGFRAKIVRQRMASSVAAPGSNPVPTSLFAYTEGDFEGIERQIDHIRSSPEFDLRRVWPDGTSDEETDPVEVMATELLTKPANATRRILHLCCHFQLPPEGADAGQLPYARFAFGDEVFVGMIALGGRMTQKLSQSAGATSHSDTIVFLNACQTAAATLDDEALPIQFIKFGFQNLIAGETLIPDRIAAVFAIFFYAALFRGVAFGDAVLRARRELLHRFSNPAGILFTAFGDPDFRVRQAQH